MAEREKRSRKELRETAYIVAGCEEGISSTEPMPVLENILNNPMLDEWYRTVIGYYVKSARAQGISEGIMYGMGEEEDETTDYIEEAKRVNVLEKQLLRQLETYTEGLGGGGGT